MKTIILPGFEGFYNTHLDIFEIIDFEEDNINYLASYNNTAKGYVKEFLKAFKEDLYKFGFDSIKFDSLEQQKEHNFENDKIFISCEVDYSKVISFISNNKEDFKSFLLYHYTSRNGFISLVSNDYYHYYTALLDGTVSEKDLSVLLEFISGSLDTEGFNSNFEYDLYEKAYEYVEFE